MNRRDRKNISFASTIIPFLITMLGGSLLLDPILACGLQQQSPKNVPPGPQDESVTEEVLPWQPGLGKPIQPASATPLPGVFNQNGIPKPAAAPPFAQPISRLPGSQPRSVLRDQNVTPIPPIGNSGGAVPAAMIPQNQPSGYPVVPTALLEQAGTQEPNSENNEDNSNIVDAGITSVTRGVENLPNTAGQIWRTYDISPYTYMVKNTARPQQAVIDWITKETGTDLWFAEPLGILSATNNKLHVYHTPEIQNRIKPIVDRFVQTRAAPQVMGLRLATIASPNWRTMALTLMQPVPIDSTGIEAWLMTKENAAILMGQLRNRTDYQERNNGDIVVTDGQKYVLSQTRPVEFLRSLSWVNQGGGYYQPVTDRIDEGYTVELSALSSLDGRTIEAIVGCKIDQIEQLQPVSVQLPGLAGQTQTAQLQIPQMVSWRANERFRWPSDQVLVLSCGVVATPGPQRQALLGIPSLLNGSRGRADALMFIEYKGKAATTPGGGAATPVTVGQTLPIQPRR